MTGKKGKMARMLVWLCIGVLLTAAVWGMVVKTVSPDSDLADVLTFIAGSFLYRSVYNRLVREAEAEAAVELLAKEAAK